MRFSTFFNWSALVFITCFLCTQSQKQRLQDFLISPRSSTLRIYIFLWTSSLWSIWFWFVLMEHLLTLFCGRVLTWILDGAKRSNWQCWLLFWHTPGRLTSHATVWFFKTYCCNASLKSDIFWRLLSRLQTQSLEYLELQLSRCLCCDMAHCRELHCSEFNDVKA